jgi:hypothetical protein
MADDMNMEIGKATPFLRKTDIARKKTSDGRTIQKIPRDSAAT